MIVKHICSVSINICSTISQIFKSARPGKFIAQIVFLFRLLLFKAIISKKIPRKISCYDVVSDSVHKACPLC